MELDNNAHSVFLLYYHLVLVIKYRRKVIDDKIEETDLDNEFISGMESSNSVDELEELLEQQFTMEFSNLEKLELECKEISSPDKLGDVILDEICTPYVLW